MALPPKNPKGLITYENVGGCHEKAVVPHDCHERGRGRILWVATNNARAVGESFAAELAEHRTAMNIERNEHAPLQWYQFRLSFVLLLITLVSVIMSLGVPRYTPDRECGQLIPYESRPDPELEQAFNVIITSGSASTVHWINLHDELAEEERVAKTAAACTSKSQTPPAADKPGD
jgi:hypothetical protein